MELPDYLQGKPELVAVKYVFPVGQKLGWHHHPVMNYGVLMQGELTIIGLDGKKKVVHEGEPVVEMVNTIHHGENRGDKDVILYMFYLSQEGLPLAVQHPEMTSLYRSDFFEIQRSLTGKEADQNMVNLTLCYYCSQLKQTFSRTVQMRYEMGKVYGLEENIVPHFTIGTTKYPVVMTLNVSAFIDKADIQPAQGDYFAAFIGEECRGVSSADNLSIIVYGRQEGESITLKYYQTATGKVFDFSDVAKTKR